MTILQVEGLTKFFYSGFFHSKPHRILADVSFRIAEGTTLGLIGESGSGKSTLARLIARLIEPTAGRITFMGNDLSRANGRSLKEIRKQMQIVFQDPETALNPRMKLSSSLAEPLRIHSLARRGMIDQRIREMAQRVDLNEELLDRYPHELSGGQIQRAVLARSLVLRPAFIIFDEPTSMLDLSCQAQVLTLMKTIQREWNLTYLFISHDLDVVRFMSDSIAVLHQGELVEYGPARDVLEQPQHPYTKRLAAFLR